jgi:hypothetical protein
MAAHNFAAQNKGVFPTAHRHTLGTVFPSMLNFDDTYRVYLPGTHDTNYWKHYGLDFVDWVKFGVQRGDLPNPPPLGGTLSFEPAGISNSQVVCPSAVAEIQLMTPGDSLWGTQVWGHYMYVGGISKEYFDKKPLVTTPGIWDAQINWGSRVPAIRVNDKSLSRRVLAADEVFRWTTADRPRINHRNRTGKGDPDRPAWQNILFGDGHVEGFGSSYFPEPLNTTNFSVGHYHPNYGYFYWGRSSRGAVSGVITEVP